MQTKLISFITAPPLGIHLDPSIEKTHLEQEKIANSFLAGADKLDQVISIQNSILQRIMSIADKSISTDDLKAYHVAVTKTLHQQNPQYLAALDALIDKLTIPDQALDIKQQIKRSSRKFIKTLEIFISPQFNDTAVGHLAEAHYNKSITPYICDKDAEARATEDGILATRIGIQTIYIVTNKNPNHIQTLFAKSDTRGGPTMDIIAQTLGENFVNSPSSIHSEQRSRLFGHLTGAQNLDTITSNVWEIATDLFKTLKASIKEQLRTGNPHEINLNEIVQLYTARVIALFLDLDPRKVTIPLATNLHATFSAALNHATDTSDYTKLLQQALPERPVKWLKTLGRMIGFPSRTDQIREEFYTAAQNFLEQAQADQPDPQSFRKTAEDAYGKNTTAFKENVYPFAGVGTDTSHSLIIMACVHLFRNPKYIPKMLNETLRIPEIPSYTDLNTQLLELDRFIREILRLYPPAPLLMRKTNQNLTLGTTEIPKGAIVIIPTMPNQRSQSTYVDPDTFLPERQSIGLKPFTANEDYSFAPFGIGHHYSCIGKYLATLEARIFLIFFMKLTEEFNVGIITPEGDLKLKSYGTSCPDQPVIIKVTNK